MKITCKVTIRSLNGIKHGKSIKKTATQQKDRCWLIYMDTYERFHTAFSFDAKPPEGALYDDTNSGLVNQRNK